jgi:imidazolonepropionase-like amidohydrolase
MCRVIGMTPTEAIVAATSSAVTRWRSAPTPDVCTRLLGDLLIIDGDPLAGITVFGGEHPGRCARWRILIDNGLTARSRHPRSSDCSRFVV